VKYPYLKKSGATIAQGVEKAAGRPGAGKENGRKEKNKLEFYLMFG
jgi:hypothetical protein